MSKFPKPLLFLLVCKPQSHPELYDWVDCLERSGAVTVHVVQRWTGKRYAIDTYRYVAAVPLRAGDEALTVQWCELTTTTTDGKVLYRNAFANSHPIDASTVAEVIAAGRTRWKIENENNNTLKTKGYHFEHNYGHGQQHLSSLLATLILLAYLLHTLLEWMDDQYCLLRQKLPSRQRLFAYSSAFGRPFQCDSATDSSVIRPGGRSVATLGVMRLLRVCQIGQC